MLINEYEQISEILICVSSLATVIKIIAVRSLEYALDVC